MVNANWVKDGCAFRLCSSDGIYWVECLEVYGWDRYKDISEDEADDLIESLEFRD